MDPKTPVPFKVTNHDRSERKGVVAGSFSEFVDAYKMDPKTPVPFKVTNHDRSERKGVVAGSFSEFVDAYKMDPKTPVPFKVTNHDRSKRKGVVAGSFSEFVDACKTKFATDEARFVLEEDGTEVDGAYWITLESNTVLMLLNQDQRWTPRNEPVASTPGFDAGSQRVMEMVQRLREAGRKKSSASQATSNRASVLAGWQNYSYRQHRYCIIKNSTAHPDVGPRPISLAKDSSYAEVLAVLTEEFFPRGKNSRGKVGRYACLVGNAKGEALQEAGFTFGNYIITSTTTRPRIYLLTKEKFGMPVDSSSDSDFEQSPPVRTQTASVSAPASTMTTPIYTQSGPSMPQTNQAASWAAGAPSTPDQDTWVNAGTPSVAMRVTTDRPKCPVCLVNPKDTFARPCGHTVCSGCSLQIRAMGQWCPTCRAPVDGFNNIYD